MKEHKKMKPHQIENWILEVVERVTQNQPVEDSRVELKSTWPDPERAARRIAGHANSARGIPILWIIGLDENKGVIGAEKTELSNWFSQVRAKFEGLEPEMIDLGVPTKNRVVVGLLFYTDRGPYIVRNPSFGKQNGGPVEFEVPWRDGTATRTARRSDLIRLLTPYQKKPAFEILSGYLDARNLRNNDFGVIFHLDLTLYVEPPIGILLIIPFHRCTVKVKPLVDKDWLIFKAFRLFPPSLYSSGGSTIPLSKTIEVTGDEVIIHAPGKIRLNANYETSDELTKVLENANISITISPTNSEISNHIKLNLQKVKSQNDELARWEFINPK